MDPHSFEKLDPDPHSHKKLDPDPHKVNADPEHCCAMPHGAWSWSSAMPLSANSIPKSRTLCGIARDRVGTKVFVFVFSRKLTCNVYICICFCYRIPLKELRANINFRKGFRGVIKDSAVSMRPRKLLLRSIWDRESRFRGIYETAEAASAVSKRSPNPLWHRKFAEKIEIIVGNVETPEAIHFQQLSQFSQRIQSHIRNGFSPWINCLMKKKPRVENLVTLSL
jgi:hypothetical protein